MGVIRRTARRVAGDVEAVGHTAAHDVGRVVGTTGRTAADVGHTAAYEAGRAGRAVRRTVRRTTGL